DLVPVRRGAELPEQVLEHIHGNVEADLELLDQVLSDHAPSEDVEELAVEVVDYHLVHCRQVSVLLRTVHLQSHSSKSTLSSTSHRSRSSSLSASRTSTCRWVPRAQVSLSSRSSVMVTG